MAGGTELPVLAVEGDWYQVLVDGEPAWLAGWLTTRLPATDPTPTRVKLLAMGETWEEPVTGCKLLVGKVADEAGDLALLLAGDGRREVRVDVFLPGAASALPLADSSESLADVMGNPVTVRTWPASLRWPAGRYRFALGLGELSSEFEWEMPGPGEYSLLVDCERPAAASVTGEAPVRMLVAEQIYRDQETGCNLFLSALQGQAGLDVLLLGERRREARVYLFLPGEETALQPEREKEEDQPDEGEAHVALFYSRDSNWRTGLYRIELNLGEVSSVFGWEMERPGKYALLVDCERPASAPVTDDAPPQLVLTGEIYRDRGDTGCRLVVTAEEGQAGFEVIYIGEQRREVRVELFLPDERTALPPEPDRKTGQFDDGVAYIAQTYASDLNWRPGLYRIELKRGESGSAFVWNMESLGKYFLFVDCDASPTGESASDQAPVMLKLEESYLDPVSGCAVLLFPDSPDHDLNLIIEGERHSDAVARVFRPEASRPVPVEGRLDRIHTDSDTPYILQFYAADQYWPAGLYRLELELEGRVSEFGWHMESPHEQSLYIRCDQAPRDGAAAGVTVGPTPVPPRVPDAEEINQDAPLFHVDTNSNLNLRACGNRDCEQVGQVPGGTRLPVYAVEGDWYQALVNGEPVWLAGWLTTRVPDMVLEDTSMILDERTGCTVLLGARQLFDVLHIMVGGDRHEDVHFDFFAPGAGEPLTYSDRSTIGLEESDGTMIEHVYQGVLVSAGEPYRLLIELDGRSNLVEWVPARSGGTAIFIICNDPETLDSETGPGPISSAATQISQVPAAAVTADPTPATVLEIGDTLRDAQSGCLVRLAPESPGQDLGVVLSGERRAEVEVRVFRPGAGQALPFSDRVERYLVEGEPPIIRQNYSADLDWPWGLYRLEVEVDGRVSAYAWRMEFPTDQFFLIICEETSAIPATPATPATPAPDAASPRLLETDVAWRDDHTGCEILVSDRKLDGDLNIWITSPRPEDVQVRVYRPGESSQVPFSGRFRDDIEEADLPLDWQYYKTDDSWRDGTWQLEISLDGKSSRFAWQLENAGDMVITILCDAPDLKLALTTPSPDSQEAGRDEAQVSVEPTPPRVLETDVIYRDDHTGCDIIIDPDALDGDLNLALAGDRFEDIEARVYRPGSDTPLRYTDRVDDVFAESDEAFIWQYYTVTSPWIDGLYRLEIELDGRSTQGLWELERGGDQLIYVFCNTDENQLPVATLTPTPTATPSPTVTATPSPTRTPVPTRARVLGRGENLRDFITGCDLFLDHEGLDGHFHLVFTDSRQEEVEAWVYRPGDSQPYEYSSRRNETFDDSGEPFVWQIYRNFGSWPDGMYRLQIELDGRVSEVFWDLKRGGDQVIYISCDRSVPPATVTPTPTLTWTPSPTPTPTLTATPTPPEADADVRTGALHKDEATGCTLLVLEFPPEQVDWKDLWITRGGSERDFVEVEVWLPDAETPLPIDEMYEDVIETGESLIVQSYSPRTDWRNGLYRFDLGLDGAFSSLTWRMSGPGYYAVSVTCDRARGPAPSV